MKEERRGDEGEMKRMIEIWQKQLYMSDDPMGKD